MGENAAIKTSAERLLLKLHPDPVCICDARSLAFLDVNPAAVARWGYAREHLLGMALGQVVLTPNSATLSAHCDEETAHVCTIRCSDGADMLMEFTLHSVDWRGSPALLFCTSPLLSERLRFGQDLSQREREFRLNEERFRLLAKATNDVIWDWEFATQTMWWNDAYEDLFGYPPSEVDRGLVSYADRIHPDDLLRVMSDLQAVIDGGGTNWLNEYRCLRNDGRSIWISERAFVIRDEHGVAVRMLGSNMDVSQRYETDERMRQSQRLEAIGQLTGGVAHDFNNILTVILGNAELLADELSETPALLGLAQNTVAAAHRAAELTRRLLAFSRNQELEPRLVYLGGLLTRMYDMLRRTLTEDIEILLQTQDDLWAVEVDPSQLEMSILNLAINARDAMPQGGRLRIETSNSTVDPFDKSLGYTGGEFVLVSVSDNGTGMSPEVVAHAFEPFFTTKEIGKGTGLGLSLIYGFVKQSHGHIEISSEVGVGTTVRLYFPRKQGSRETARENEVGPLSFGGTESILVVEDDSHVRESLSRHLQVLGYEVYAAHSGFQALSLLKQGVRIQLLLSDIMMPGGMDGRELARAAKVIQPDLKTLFMSGYMDQVISHQNAADREFNFIWKPYGKRELAEKIRSLLDSTLRKPAAEAGR
jgi:PAS domain S-box-containing protein